MYPTKLPIFAILILLQLTTVLAKTIILNGGTIVAYDENTRLLSVIRGGTLVIKDDRIDQILDQTSSNGTFSNDTELIDCTDKIITPGFIDTHRHGWQTVYKTMGSNTTLSDYVDRYSAFVSHPLFEPNDIYISQKMGIYEALNAGVTTILDHAHHTWTREHAAAGYNASVDSGARIYYAYTFQNVSTSNFTIELQLQQWRELDAGKATNLTSLVMAYDDWTTNTYGQATKDIVELAR